MPLRIILPCLLLTLAACTSLPAPIFTSTAQPAPTTAPEQSVYPPPVPTRMPRPTQTGSLTPYPLPAPASTATPAWQDVAGPGGQFTLQVPRGWIAAAGGAGYHGPDGYVWFTALPELADMPRALQVCERLANTTLTGWKIGLADLLGLEACWLYPTADAKSGSHRLILRNPQAPPDQRYVQLEIYPAHDRIISQSIKFRLPFSPEAAVAYITNPLEPDERAFWESTGAFSLSVETNTYPAAAAGEGRVADRLLEFVRANRAVVYGDLVEENGDPAEQANRVLAPFGYRLEPQETRIQERPFYRLLRGSEVLLEEVRSYSLPFTSPEGEDFVFILQEAAYREWLLRPSGVSEWNRDPFTTILANPILYRGGLLYPVWNPETGQVQLLLEGEPLFGYTTFFVNNPVSYFTGWEGSWLLEVRGSLIQDGVLLNEALGYEEIFNLGLIDGRPAYYFRKGPRLGFAYGDEILPLEYEAIYHGGCCGYTVLNPRSGESGLRFFGLRAGQWDWVEVDFGGINHSVDLEKLQNLP